MDLTSNPSIMYPVYTQSEKKTALRKTHTVRGMDSSSKRDLTRPSDAEWSTLASSTWVSSCFSASCSRVVIVCCSVVVGVVAGWLSAVWIKAGAENKCDGIDRVF